jgi:ABC-type sugar transport system permease subunit
MSVVQTKAGRLTLRPAFIPGSVSRIVLRLLALAVIDAFALWFLYQLLSDGVIYLALTVGIITLLINVIFLKEGLYPLRWMSPGLALVILMVVYPVLFTVYSAFTNYSDGHILTKQQAIGRLEQDLYLPEGGSAYSWTAFRSPTGEYALWLVSEDGDALLARPGEVSQEVASGETGVGPLDEDGIPQSIEGYERLDRIAVVRHLSELDKLEFGAGPNTIRIRSLDEAAELQSKYVYDASQDAMVDQKIGTVYRAVEGTFTSSEGDALWPGFQVWTGLDNFRRLTTSPALRGPFIRVFIWTFAFAFLTVFTTFALGLFVALVFDDPNIPGKKLIRSLLIIPYTIPSTISILIWRGMLNEQLGVLTNALEDLVGWSPAWFSDPMWAKVAIVLINLWLGYPYMMLICSGALQAIPSDVYEAGEVDGAGIWQRFRYLTLPLLLVAVGPLLIASFAFNFNNFNVIYLYNEGGPPIPGTITPAGHTDILITYTFRQAFASGRGADYGYGAAITIVIFAILAVITFFNFRYTRIWEEVSENV